ncbi:thioredoxin family protein [Bacillus daqingensis]|uniref:Thioredoxin family protein n=1 Tax=Bacillus daqingensis TaxID=872396 RepID=A0ABV9NYA0_9BACI
MKKILLFGGIAVALFVTLIVVVQLQNQQQAEGNPFGKSTLAQETIDQLDDPNYQNVILPEELDERLANGEDALIYFYSGQCEYCNQATPVLVPMAEDAGADLELYNVLEFNEGWEDYNLEGTPTVILFEDGEEVDRITGLGPEEEYEQLFERAAD